MSVSERNELFTLASDMYKSNCEDPYLLIKIFEYLLPYFVEEKDLCKEIFCHSYIFFESNDYVREFYDVKNFDLTHALEIFKYKESVEDEKTTAGEQEKIEAK